MATPLHRLLSAYFLNSVIKLIKMIAILTANAVYSVSGKECPLSSRCNCKISLWKGNEFRPNVYRIIQFYSLEFGNIITFPWYLAAVETVLPSMSVDCAPNWAIAMSASHLTLPTGNLPANSAAPAAIWVTPILRTRCEVFGAVDFVAKTTAPNVAASQTADWGTSLYYYYLNLCNW